MKKNRKADNYCIPPNYMLIGCYMLLLFLGILEFVIEGNIKRHLLDFAPSTLILLGITMAIALCRTVKFNSEYVVVYYLFPFLRRKIDITRVRSFEFVQKGKEKFLFVVLDKAPNYMESKANFILYGILHPIGVITININAFPDGKFDEHQKRIRKMFPRIKVNLYSDKNCFLDEDEFYNL